MGAKILSGAECAAACNAETGTMAAEFTRKHGLPPALAVILVGDDPASQVYVNSKAKKCAELGIRSEKFASTFIWVSAFMNCPPAGSASPSGYQV